MSNYERYERKIKKMKRCIKNYVVENSSLCDVVSKIQEQIATSNAERDFLLKKLMEYEPQSFDFIQQPQNSATETHTYKYKKRKNSDTNSEATLIEGKKKISLTKKQMSAQSNQRLHVSSTNDGVSNVNYGKIINDRQAYSHSSEGTVNPVGYKISRVVNGSNYVCRVLDDDSPLYEIYKENEPSMKFNGAANKDAHSSMLQTLESNSTSMDEKQDAGTAKRKFKDMKKA